MLKAIEASVWATKVMGKKVKEVKCFKVGNYEQVLIEFSNKNVFNLITGENEHGQKIYSPQFWEFVPEEIVS